MIFFSFMIFIFIYHLYLWYFSLINLCPPYEFVDIQWANQWMMVKKCKVFKIKGPGRPGPWDLTKKIAWGAEFDKFLKIRPGVARGMEKLEIDWYIKTGTKSISFVLRMLFTDVEGAFRTFFSYNEKCWPSELSEAPYITKKIVICSWLRSRGAHLISDALSSPREQNQVSLIRKFLWPPNMAFLTDQFSRKMTTKIIYIFVLILLRKLISSYTGTL